MRELARLLIALRSPGNPDKCLAYFISPYHYKDIVRAIKTVAEFDYEKGVFNIPSLALKLGHSLSKCATLLKAKAIEEGLCVEHKQHEDFLKSYVLGQME